MPSGDELKALMGVFAPLVAGYNDDPREVYVIPEVRKFWRTFHEQWPYWLFFFVAQKEVMAPMMWCRMDSFTVLNMDGKENCAVQFDKREVVKILSNDFGYMNELCNRAGMTDAECYDRTAEIFKVFDVPFNEPRP